MGPAGDRAGPKPRWEALSSTERGRSTGIVPAIRPRLDEDEQINDPESAVAAVGEPHLAGYWSLAWVPRPVDGPHPSDRNLPNHRIASIAHLDLPTDGMTLKA